MHKQHIKHLIMDTITEIIPHLFVGGYGGAMNEELLTINNIKSIITLHSKLELPHKNKYEYYLFDMYDIENFQIEDYFNEILNIIHKSIQNNNNILIHCYCGASRSVTFCIAYLIQYQNMTLVQSYELIRKKREIIEPNEGFIKKLIIWYKQSKDDFEIYVEYLRIINIINAIKITNVENVNAICFYKKKLNTLLKKLNINN